MGPMGAPALPFTKLQGCGNDYVVVDALRHPVGDPAALARAVTDRRRGVGADGLLLALPSESADVRMRMFNPDGSEAEMCGNGLRCLARFAAQRGLVPDPAVLRVETGAGVLDVRIREEAGRPLLVSVDMGPPRLERAEIPMLGEPGRVVDEPLAVGGENVDLTAVSMGNPHAVLFVEDVAAAPLSQVGPRLENHTAFPRRTNVEFVQVLSRSEVRQRTWERGVGETQACGTGACAVVVAGVLSGRTDRAVTVHLVGGDLDVTWREDDHVLLTGPAVEVFDGAWPLD